MQEMLALLGCTYEEMRGVLEALGYQSQTIADEAAEGLRPELSAPVPDRFIHDKKPKPKKPEPVTKAMTEASVPAPKVETTSTETEATTEATSEDTALPAQDSAPQAKPASKSKSGPKPLNIYNFRTTHEDGTVTEEINNEFWFLPFKGKKPRGGKSRYQDNKGHQSSYKKRKPHKKAHGGKPPKYGKSEPRKDEDSPFAALAALKKGLSGDKD